VLNGKKRGKRHAKQMQVQGRKIHRVMMSNTLCAVNKHLNTAWGKHD